MIILVKGNDWQKFEQMGNRCQVTKYTVSGLTFSDEVIRFKDKMEGNAYYKNLCKDGYEKATVEQEHWLQLLELNY